MKVNRKELLDALNIVKPGLSNKEIIEQTTSFAFVDGRVYTYNDEISISHPVANLGEDGAIHAEELFKFLNKASAEEITVDKTDKEIIFKSGRSKVGFTLKREITLPLNVELTKKEKWKPLPDRLKHALHFVAHTCSKDMTDPKLTCVHINKQGFVEGTDNFRIAHFKLGKKLPIGTLLIPATSAVEAGKLDPIEVCQGDGWVHYRNEDKTIFSTRVLKENFVDTSNILSKQKGGIKLNFPKELLEVLEKAQIFANRKNVIDESVDVILKKNSITISSKSDNAWFKEKLDIKYKGKDFEFRITPYLLQDILKETLECTLYNDRLRFNSEHWTYVTALRWSSNSE